MKAKQTQFGFIKKDVKFFGGALLYRKRKDLRPLSSKEALHLVMKSTWARGENSFLHRSNKNEINRLITITAKKYLVRVYRRALAGNHIHLVIKFPSRKHYRTFIRVLTSRIASHVMKQQSFKTFRRKILEKAGDPPKHQGKEQQFWQFRPFTRIVNWGRDFKKTCEYVVKNTLEALGFVPYQKRNQGPYERILRRHPLLC